MADASAIRRETISVPFLIEEAPQQKQDKGKAKRAASDAVILGREQDVGKTAGVNEMQISRKEVRASNAEPISISTCVEMIAHENPMNTGRTRDGV